MSAPVRVVLSRRAGWRLPPGGRSVANGSRYANPYRPAVRSLEANAESVERYRSHLAAKLAEDPRWLDRLVGATALACVCPLDLPCHVDVIVEELIRRYGP